MQLKISSEKKKFILAIINLSLIFMAGYVIGEKIVQIKCNNFIEKEYLNNPIYEINEINEDNEFIEYLINSTDLT